MSSDMLLETVPRLTKRVGDASIANENNATILLGRDRIGSVDSGYGDKEGSSAIHLIVGRATQNPSIDDDRATVYLSARSDPDTLAATQDVGHSEFGFSSIICKADCTRIVARNDIKISVGPSYLVMDQFGKVTINGTAISLGERASNAAILGTPYRANEAAANAAIMTAMASIGAALAALATFPAFALLTPITSACSAATGAATSAASALSSFEAGAAEYLSALTKLV